MLAPDLERIPQELKARPQWVTYRPDKTPVNPVTGENAKENDPETWTEFSQAIRHWKAHKRNGIAGIGYQFSFHDPYCGVALEMCRNPETGGISYWAWKIIKRLKSYTEISPSGQGVKIWVKGKLPPGSRCKGTVEMYDSKQYFALTGHHLKETPTTIEDRQEELIALHAEIFNQEKKAVSVGPYPTIDFSDQEAPIPLGISFKDMGDSQFPVPMIDLKTKGQAQENPRYNSEPPATEIQKQSITPGIPLWPNSVMAGAAGRFARSYAEYLETPAPFLFMSYLTILGHLISEKITLQSEINPQPKLYTVNLGESSDARKSTSIFKTVSFFQEVIDPDYLNIILGVGSAEGLAQTFKNLNRGILVLDELKALTQKMRIDASVLLTCINTLFEMNWFHNTTKNHEIKIDDASLCLLGASTIETYRNIFTPQFLDIGFVNRLFIVIGGGERKFAIPQAMPGDQKEGLKQDLLEVLKFVDSISKGSCYALPLTSEARDIFEEWYFAHEISVFSKRLDAYGHRLMPLLAVNEQKETITPEIAERVVALLNYQLAARKYADPIDADNAIAKLEERIRRALGSGPMKKRDLERSCSKNRVGTSLWNTAVKNLTSAGEIVFDGKVYNRPPS